MFLHLSPLFLRGFSSSVAMDASILPPRNAVAAHRDLTRLLAPRFLSYTSFLSINRQLRNSRRWYASSPEPPFPFLQPHLVPKEQIAKPKTVKEDCNLGSIPKTRSTGTAEYMPILEQELLDETATQEFQEASSVDMPVDPRLLGRRQRKRKTVVPKARKRLYSEEEDLGYMQEALVEARKAAKQGEVPVGAVLVHNNKIIARFHNQVETSNDPTAHAEMLCIRSAAAQLGSWRLTDVTMYVTLEPCPMCAGAILQGRVSELVWGAPNSLLGADGSWIKLFPVSSTCEQEPKGKDYLHPFHRTITVRRGVLAEESADIMQTFFSMRRLQPKCATADARIGVKSAPWPRFPAWFPPALKKLNYWVHRWFQF